MPVPTDQLAEELGEVKQELKDLSNGVAHLHTEFAEFRAVVQTELKFIGRLGAWFVATMVSLFLTVIVGAISIAWNAGTVVSEVRQQGVHLDKVDKRFDGIEADVRQQGKRLEGIEAEVRQQSGRFDKVEKRLDGIEAEVRQHSGRFDKVEKRLDGIEKQLDVLIRRTEPKAAG